MKEKIKGYLTIYLALSLTALLAIVMVLLIGIKKNTTRMEEELALDTAGWSALSEYHQELLKQYDLFFIDTSYGTCYPGIDTIGEHVKNYADKNLRNTGLTDGRVKLVGIQEASVATDDGGEVIKQQIIEYMENYYGIEDLEKLIGKYEAALPGQVTGEKELMKQREENEERLRNEPPPKKTVTKSRYNAENGKTETYKEEEEVPIENPAEHVNNLRNAGVLNLVTENPAELSKSNVFVEQYISHRTDRLQGTGILEEKREKSTLLGDFKNRALIHAYIFQKYGYYGHEKENSQLAYQVEYLIGKKSSDIENLKAVVHKLLLVREAANAAYLYQDAQKRAEIAAMASSVAAVTVAPYLEPLLETSILFAWAYVESLQDVKLLLEGEKIPIMKTAGEWRTGLNRILDFENGFAGGKSSKGLDYEQYLTMLLYLEGEQGLLFSMMDVMEMDIRKTAYNENFCMDSCVSGFRLAVEFESSDGTCVFNRAYYY